MYRLIVLFFILCFFTHSSIANDDLITVTEFKKGAFIFEIKNDPEKIEVIPYVSESLETNKDVYKKLNALLVVNGGYFDLKNKKSVSDIVINQKCVASSRLNENLVFNEKLKFHLDKIYSRSEFRVIKCKDGKIRYDICEPKQKIGRNECLLHSIQAGPMVLPRLRIVEEYFLHINPKTKKICGQSASILNPKARTVVALKKDDPNLYVIIYTNDAPVNIFTVYDDALDLGFEKVLNFDGGVSTSINYKNIDINSAPNLQARKLKSFLTVVQKK